MYSPHYRSSCQPSPLISVPPTDVESAVWRSCPGQALFPLPCLSLILTLQRGVTMSYQALPSYPFRLPNIFFCCLSSYRHELCSTERDLSYELLLLLFLPLPLTLQRGKTVLYQVLPSFLFFLLMFSPRCRSSYQHDLCSTEKVS